MPIPQEFIAPDVVPKYEKTSDARASRRTLGLLLWDVSGVIYVPLDPRQRVTHGRFAKSPIEGGVSADNWLASILNGMDRGSVLDVLRGIIAALHPDRPDCIQHLPQGITDPASVVLNVAIIRRAQEIRQAKAAS